ncbi:MAG TPA: 2-amino-4-hydroxy-6-hydroxymethyldihydropteridine diphosphokinase [Blastocatellia bacterium]|nr:2-amino-4-hydroxy-6-hydroxymethyldihydropteridine diphosphokinase [Blastocatellia bacterium]
MTNGGRSKESEIAVYLGLGSNLGDREANLREAIARIKALGLEVVRESSIYETEPVGFADQPWFLNQVIETTILAGLTSEHGPVPGDPETIATMQAEALLSDLLQIEHEMGRERVVANGPRAIDVDLLLFGDMIIGHLEEDITHSKEVKEGLSINLTGIVVPHPRMHLRRFVLEPLCEIAPDIVLPVQRKTCREMLAGLDDDSVVRISKQRFSTASQLDQRE